MSEIQIIEGLHVLGTTLNPATNTPEWQLGNVIDGDTESSGAVPLQQPGIVSLPANAVPGASAADGVVLLRTSGRDYVVGGRDVVAAKYAGELSPGEIAIFSVGPDGTGQARLMCKGDGSITMQTTEDNTGDGNNITFRLSPTGLEFKASFGKLTFDRTGFHVADSTGARIDLGGIAAPGPLAALVGNSVTITGDVVSLNSSGVTLGPAGGTTAPAVVSVIPVAVPGVPIEGAGVGAVVVAATASPYVRISSGLP